MPRPIASPSRTGCAPRSSSCSSARSVPARSTPRSAPISTSTSSRPPPSCTIRRARSCAAPRPPRRPATRGKPARRAGARANNLPTERAAARQVARQQRASNKTEETVNYEISRTVRNQTKRGATLRRLSIAVQVDGIYRRSLTGDRLRAARRRGAGAARGPGAQRRRHRREPRRRGRGGEPPVPVTAAAEPEPEAGWQCVAGIRPVRRARRAQPAHPAGPVLRRAAGAAPRARGRRARDRPSPPRWCSVPTASRCSCTAPPAPRSASIVPAIPWSFASRRGRAHGPRPGMAAGSRAGADRPQARPRRGPGLAPG